LYSPESAPVIAEAFRKALETGEPYDLELKLSRADGRTIWIRTIGRATRENGRIVRVSGDIIDIDELKRAQLEVASLNARLEQLVLERTARLEQVNKDLELFLHSLSHDLKAPLRAIAGFSRIVEEDYADSLGAEGRRKLSVISDNATLLDSMLTEIVSLTRVDAANTSRTKIDMRSMAVAMYHEVASAEDIAAVEFVVGTIPDAYGDSTLLRKVWGRLLASALMSTAGKKARSISVHAETDDAGSKYIISDNGRGFDPKYKDRLFLPLVQPGSVPDHGGGTGLAIVKRIVEMHLGTVDAEGEVDKGSSFWFWLPALNPASPGDNSEKQ
jgi:light-regulated signal transduction histidine kinase (bacteriophytochrome)